MKTPFIDYELYNTFFKRESIKTKKKKRLKLPKTQGASRSSTIIKKFVGNTISVHNGKTID